VSSVPGASCNGDPAGISDIAAIGGVVLPDIFMTIPAGSSAANTDGARHNANNSTKSARNLTLISPALDLRANRYLRGPRFRISSTATPSSDILAQASGQSGECYTRSYSRRARLDRTGDNVA